MPGGSRSLPGHPSLRYLRLEAKRRLAAGEFPALHDAQAAIAREHGLPNWATLKQHVTAIQKSGQEPGQPPSHALNQLRWLIARFSDADSPAWTAPADAEMREHVDDRFLAAVPVSQLVEAAAGIAPELRGELLVITQTPFEAQVQLGGLRYLAAVADEPPHRLLGLHGFQLAKRLADPRLTESPASPSRPAPQNAPKVTPVAPTAPKIAEEAADEAVAELGLPALIVAGGEPGTPPWVLTRGRPDLDQPEALTPGHRFPAPGVTALVTATAVLRLIAQNRLSLDTPANDHLRTVRLENDAITVRDLLTHTSGVENPTSIYGDSVRDVATLMGSVIPCPGPRGQTRPGNGAYAVLGQLIEDVTGAPFADAVTGLVLDPLEMRDSSFPRQRTQSTQETHGTQGTQGTVTTYQVTPEGTFAPVWSICTVQAVAGLWSTGADLVRLGTGWASLLPDALAREALTPQAELKPGIHTVGLGWLLAEADGIAVHQGMGVDSAASLVIRISDYRTHVVLANRQITLNSLNDRLRRNWTTNQ